jgi:hypothetical protein
MQHVPETGGIERRDGLHIDDIEAVWSERSRWIEGMIESLNVARSIRLDVAPDKVIALMCSLVDGPSEVPMNLDELAAQMDWTPPSLYLFEAGKEPWRDMPTTVELRSLPSDHFSGL